MRYKQISYPPIDYGETQLEYKKRKQAIRNLLKELEICEFDIEKNKIIADLNMLGYNVKQ